jgi:hypothetical protein
MYRFLLPIAISILMPVGYILMLDYYSRTEHVKRLSEAVKLSEDRHRQNMLRICRTYREWQRLPDLTDSITEMDTICERHEKMIH